ncbi:hypothetical protein J4H86_08540 [Spiractinospora alimapuensis]|uniref:hypothetical protein n=1 Tax=Spiractinospora alimapuensis TaxID=2820884 RepID=UPI001F363BCB|nr:hypothetical protein [Spiractinospora alimapuensis]QVQ53749.1 hypothetical protein J4H86_08540 [Spiractinospora alimapuensis]
MTTRLTESHRAAPAPGREIGSLISAGFGLTFVWINSGELPSTARIPLLVAAVAAAVAIVMLSLRDYRRRTLATTPPEAGAVFGWKYWAIVGVEVAALMAGSQILSRLGYPELGVAWVAFVVGTHFFPLGIIFRLRVFHLLGAVITGLGLAGFVVRMLGHVDPIAVVSGVLSGIALLGFGLCAFLSSSTEKE